MKRLVAALALVAATIGVIAGNAPVAADVPELAPRSQRVVLISDSVGLGTRGIFPTYFPADWSATVVGTPAMFVEQLQATYVDGGDPAWFGDHAVIAGGYNYPYWDPARFDRSIDSMVRALRARGVRHIHWVTLREVKPEYISPAAWRQVQPYYWYFPTVNDHLERALARHPDLHLVDWAAVADRTGITYDAIHLNTAGAHLYSGIVRESVDTVVRQVGAGSVTEITVPDPTGTAAVAVNLTSVGPRTSGYFTAFGCDGSAPVVSNHNHGRNEVLASAAIVPVGPNGSICVASHDSSHLIVDTTGRFPAGAGVVPVTPTRLRDTRQDGPASHPAGVPLRVPVAGVAGVPTDPAAVALAVTAVGTGAAGYVTVAGCDRPLPATSNVNHGPSGATPNLVVIAPGPTGEVCVVPSAPVELVVDVFAAFEPTADVDLLGPVRALDTRATLPVAAGGTAVVDLTAAGVAPGSSGALLNLTATRTAGSGYLTAYPCDAALPNASNLNMSGRGDVANFAIVAPDAAGRVCVFTSVSTDLVVDVFGSFGAVFEGRAPTRLLDTRTR